MKLRYTILVIGILIFGTLLVKFQTSETDCSMIYGAYGDFYDAYSKGLIKEEDMNKAIRCGCAKYWGDEQLSFIGKAFYKTDLEYRNYVDKHPYLFGIEVPKLRRLIC